MLKLLSVSVPVITPIGLLTIGGLLRYTLASEHPHDKAKTPFPSSWFIISPVVFIIVSQSLPPVAIASVSKLEPLPIVPFQRANILSSENLLALNIKFPLASTSQSYAPFGKSVSLVASVSFKESVPVLAITLATSALDQR